MATSDVPGVENGELEGLEENLPAGMTQEEVDSLARKTLSAQEHELAREEWGIILTMAMLGVDTMQKMILSGMIPSSDTLAAQAAVRQANAAIQKAMTPVAPQEESTDD